jgi:hypothetical protein
MPSFDNDLILVYISFDFSSHGQERLAVRGDSPNSII